MSREEILFRQMLMSPDGLTVSDCNRILTLCGLKPLIQTRNGEDA